MQGILLFMDNQKTVLEKWGNFLKLHGFEVLRAPSLEEAERILRSKHVHLAILDIRMQDDDDKNDISGLLFAQRPEFRSIPKIMLTAHPSFQYVQEALGPDSEGRAAAVNFVAKVDGPQALVEKIGLAFSKQIKTNWSLEINPGKAEDLPFLRLTGLVQPGLSADTRLQRAIELEDLFRRLFYDYQQIRIGAPLWHNDQRFCLPVWGQSKQGAIDSRIVVCGERSRLEDELDRLRELGPQIMHHTTQVGRAGTNHFGAAAYLLAEADLDTIQPMRNLVESNRRRPLRSAFEHLLGEILTAWHQHGHSAEEGQDLVATYRQWAGLGEDGLPRDELERRVDALVQAVRPLGKVGVERDSNSLTFRFPHYPLIICPDPVAVVYTPWRAQHVPTVCRMSPGRLSGDNILVDSRQRVWLTDFASAGQAPQWWDFCCLEAALRFDLSQAPDLEVWRELEECLVAPSGLHEHLNEQDVVAHLQTNLSLVELVRRQADAEAGSGVLPYYAGLLAWVVGNMAQYEPGGLHTRAELMRYAHLLLAAGLISRRVHELAVAGEGVKDAALAGAEIQTTGSLFLDEDGVTVRIGSDQSVYLSGQELELFRCLYDQAGQVVPRKDLIEKVFDEDFDSTDKYQERRLNSLVRRLREKIEIAPGKSRSIFSVRGKGYRLEP